MGDRRETVRYEEESARDSLYPLLSLGPASRLSILAKTPRGLNLGTSQNSSSRECLESSWKGCIARLLLARGAEKETFTLVAQALGTMKWSLSGVSRQSLEGVFSEVGLP